MRAGYHVRKQALIWRGRLLLGWLRLVQRASGALGLRNLYHRHLGALVRGTGLFDADWYLSMNPDVRQDGADPLLHYVRYGDHEGRPPIPLFDPPYYRAHARGAGLELNALLHYRLLGRFFKTSPSAWFDVEYYLRQNRDVARAGIDPLLHYLGCGGSDGRSPCRQFDSAFYLLANPDVAEAGVNPLMHYLRYGRLEGRPVTASGLGGGAAEPAPYVPAVVPDNWADLEPGPRLDDALVDVVVPVYKGKSETLRCLRSVLLALNETPHELIVINDASPDEELVEALRRQAGLGYFTLLDNDGNRGFVESANRGMALHPRRDVVLLNSDTEVFGDWLDRLRASARRDSRTATVTPLSNNATIASYPRFLHDNPYPLEVPFGELDALAARVNHGLEIETPTGVGFCLYLRRDFLDQVGLFDGAAFGRGYGEENDLCQRAITAGWRNIIAPDVFVHHLGSVSFQGERAKRVAAAMGVMDRRHPGYQRDVRQFIEEDPVAGARQKLDWARLALLARERNVLMVCHNRGGGAERHLREDSARLLEEGYGVFYLRPVAGQPHHVRINAARNILLPNQPVFALENTALLAGALAQLRISSIHVHGTVDFTAAAPGQLVQLGEALGATLELDIHDYHVICPRINLADDSGRYCGEPAERDCDNCLGALGNRHAARSIRDWREANAQLLRAADRIWVPDPDVSERLHRYHPELRIAVAPHEEINAETVQLREPLLHADEPLRVVVIGAISLVKGFEVLLECARDARQRRLPLSFSLLGYSMNDTRLQQAGVEVSGRYLEHEGHDKLDALHPHLVWLPSLWPETYSYTLSLALQGGYPVSAFDIGAIGRRLAAIGQQANLLPLSLQRNPRAINSRLLAFRARCSELPAVGVA
ncbi:MAG: glycosyltransferase [Gammaproteobacteria bacterium]|nr:glycosyltransferase [Gammaproteobacteria bacterium]